MNDPTQYPTLILAALAAGFATTALATSRRKPETMDIYTQPETLTAEERAEELAAIRARDRAELDELEQRNDLDAEPYDLDVDGGAQ